MKIVGSCFAAPINASPGWYVMIEGTQKEIYSPEPKKLAMKEADKNGYYPTVSEAGFPSYYNGVYTKCFWFYHKR